MRIKEKIKVATKKSAASIKAEGLLGFSKRSAKFIYYRAYPERKKKQVKDILFINGCLLPSEQYRVYHPKEQLMMSGLSSDVVFYEQLDPDMLKYYRGFIFFRCPVTDTIKAFIERAKECNKTCFFDIDDLVIDEKYTQLNEYVRKMPAAERALYDDGVNRMRTTLEMCDYAITSTERMKQELQHYTKEVFINRNVVSDEMVHRAIEVLKTGKNPENKSKIIMGYFSGSITHNADFELILPAILRLLKKHGNLYLQVTGILEVPEALKEFEDRIIRTPFLDWPDMLKELMSCDINLAPITSDIFNEAKSENKWTLASVVKTPTVASDFGAFKAVMEHNKTGLLVKDDEWFEAIDDLISDKDKRERLGEAAFNRVLEQHTTLSKAHEIGAFIRSKLRRNIAFMLPTTDISGGVNVILKHAQILRKRGWDVTLIDTIDSKSLKLASKLYQYRSDIPGYNIVTECKTKIETYFDTVVGTLWSTVKHAKEYPNTKNRVYLVQGFETDFFEWGSGDPRFLANATYNDETGLRYVTISLWCREWLKQKFNKTARYAPNGIELEYYPFRKRDFSDKIHILIEGDSKTVNKNTDEAFRIVEKLDPKKYEISYLSYRKEPKSWYRVDHFYNRIAPEKVGTDVYAKCDILIKTSLAESFSYPPLEMMATGGVSVVLPNGGNVEYLRDGENCLFYKQGDIDDGVAKVEKLVHDKKLRDKIIANGLKTAQKYAWENREDDIVALYK